MKNAGIFLVIVGAAGLIYTMMGHSHRLLAVFGEYQKVAAGAAIGIGVVLFALGRKGAKKEEKK